MDEQDVHFDVAIVAAASLEAQSSRFDRVMFSSKANEKYTYFRKVSEPGAVAIPVFHLP